MAVSLEKGQRISLQKDDGSKITSFCVGANWGAVETKGFFGFSGGKEAVDLDLSVIIADEAKNFLGVVYFGELKASGIQHSGDDRVGDGSGDDGLDNEVIQVNLDNLDAKASQIVFVLNSYKEQDFATIPFASIRLYEGTPSSVKNVVASFNVAKDSKFAGFVAMILGKLYKKDNEWKFQAVGEPIKDAKLEATIQTVIKNFL